MRLMRIVVAIAVVSLLGCVEDESELDGDVRVVTSWPVNEAGVVQGAVVRAACIDVDWEERDCGDVNVTYTLRDSSGALLEEQTQTLPFIYDDQYSAESLLGRTSECQESTCTFWSAEAVELDVPAAADLDTLELELSVSRDGQDSLDLVERPPEI